MIKVTVILNGTDKNPYEMYGLKMNPFPHIPGYKHMQLNFCLRELEATPIPNVNALRALLTKYEPTPEFVELCCKLYRPGEVVEFSIEFPE